MVSLSLFRSNDATDRPYPHAGAPGGNSGDGYIRGGSHPFEDLNIPGGWSAGLDTSRRSPRTCNPAAEIVCEQEYLTCKLYSGPANDAEAGCLCSGQFYGICLRAAGCAAHRYTDCVATLQGDDCPDMSVCGSNCIGGGNGLDLSGARIVPVNNYAANFLRFSTCDASLDAVRVASFIPPGRLRALNNCMPRSVQSKVTGMVDRGCLVGRARVLGEMPLIACSRLSLPISFLWGLLLLCLNRPRWTDSAWHACAAAASPGPE